MVKEAVPEESRGAVPIGLPLSKNVTVPVGMPPICGDTLAVTTSVFPRFTLVALAVSVTLEDAFATVIVAFCVTVA